MFSKKTRNLTVAVLALVMALTLSFGLFGFNTQANAATVTDELIFSEISNPSFETIANGASKTYTSTQNNVFKLIAVGGKVSVQTGSSSNKIGYRSDRLAVVFELNYATKLTIYHNSNSKSQRCVQLNSFTSDKSVAEMTENDYTGKTKVVAFDTIEGYKMADNCPAAAATAGDNNTTYTYTKVGGIAIIYNKLPAGKYVLLNGGLTSESDLYGFKLEYSTVTYDASTLEVTDQAAKYTVVKGETFDASTLPTKGTLYTADKKQSQEVELTWKNTTEDPLVYTASFTKPSGWNLVEGFTYPTITVTTIADERKVVSAVVNPVYTVAKGVEVKLPETIKATIDGVEGDLPVTWNGTTGSVDTAAYKLNAGVEIKATINEKAPNAVTNTYSWDAFENTWNNTADYELIKEDGFAVTINNIAGIDCEASFEKFVKILRNETKQLKIVTPSDAKNIKLTLWGCTYNTTKPASVTVNGQVRTFNVDVHGCNSITDKQQTDAINLDAGKTYYIEISGTNQPYISKIQLQTTEPSTTYAFEAGEKLMAVNEMPAVDSAYTFLGWTNGTAMFNAGDAVTTAGNYTALYAKLEYAGAGIKVSNGTGVRFGFTLSFYNIADQTVLVNVAKNISGMYHVTKGATGNFAVQSFKFGTNNELEMFLVMTNKFDAVNNTKHAEYCARELGVSIELTVNGKTITASNENDANNTIAKIATAVATKEGATEATKEAAKLYGYVA